ncbi:BglG family transcription antiterminator [Pelorhabdus rhamnosifermentans]|uniref:BglG family transcription antiterminator n=1 Tax=Pelorhabdus rhamnosifermentans TaxID=2772457 RepID=UPI0028B19B77|nr:BglG family transcription antiterminator [Pelorhabdus rhamnosifermentans]
MIGITLNELCTQLFIFIASTNEFIKITALAEQFRTTSRVIRYNLDKIDEFLSFNHFPKLIRKQHVGVHYDGTKEIIDRAMKKLQQPEIYHYRLGPEERVDVLLAVLLQQQDYITIDFLADKLFVSRGTVIKDLGRVRAFLIENKLFLQSSTNHGIKVVGEEKYLRRVSIALFMKTLAVNGSLQNNSSDSSQVHAVVKSEIIRLFQDIDIPFIEKCIIDGEKQLETTFSDEAFQGLVIHIAIAIKRIRLGRDIIMSNKDLTSYEITKEFATASFIARQLEEHFHIEVPYGEIGYITVHLLGSNVYAVHHENSENWAILQVLTGKILRAVSERLHEDCLIQDKSLFNGLIDHLRPAIYRLKNDLKVKNPILNEIMNNYHALFEIVKDSMVPVESYVGKGFNDEEIGYFTLHFGAALLRLNEQSMSEKKVLVVCSTGLGTAQLLASRLQQKFNVEIVDIIAYHQVQSVLQNHDVDLIVTTLSMPFESLPFVQVSPLLGEADMEKLKKYLTQYNFQPKDIFSQVVHLIEQNCQINHYDELVQGLTKIFRMEKFNIQKEVVPPLLKDLLIESTIRLNVEVKDWEEAIRIGGELLEGGGFVEHRYIDAMIRTVKEMGPYIVIVKGIAMPHARPEDGAKKIGMALLTLKKPVEFGNKENDPVNVVIFLCAIDNVTHLKALAELMQLLDDEAFKQLADRAVNKQEILRYIQKM